MEELQELAALQATISTLSRHSISSQRASDDLFLAKFLLFSADHCRDAHDMSEKCNFLASRLHQISTSCALLQELFLQQKNDICSQDKVMEKTSTNVNDAVSITLRDLEQANSTLEDFCRSYLMFHDMSGESVHDIFKNFPILAFVEGYIYQIDEQKESQLLPLNCAISQQTHTGVASEAFMKAEEKCFEALHALLASRKLWTNRIEKELKSGLEYWNLERSLCNSLLLEEQISLSDVMRAVKLKSFDYRVLNLLLYEMSNQPVNETHMEFLSASEVLVEISDDLFDYEEDVLHNSFNILRMFVSIFGPSEAPYMLAQVIAEAEEKYRELSEVLDPSLALKYQKRCQQAVVEGGGTCSPSHPMGLWTIPSLILNEHMYREQFKLGAEHIIKEKKRRREGYVGDMPWRNLHNDKFH